MNTQAKATANDCDPHAGRLLPQVNRNRCECKGSCVAACPYNVFLIRSLTQSEKSQLPWLARVKVWMHGGSQAFVIAPDACHACGLCAKACPETAITFVATQT